MEKNANHNGFELKNGKVPVLVRLKRIRDLRPHEETVPGDLQALVEALKRDPVLRHPLVADSATGAVLDGTHRLAALSLLGVQYIPAALIDYQNPLVQVDRWFRIISGETLNSFTKRVKHSGPRVTSSSDADKTLLKRSSYATLQDGELCLAFEARNSTPLELAKDAFRIEQVARDAGLRISYRDNPDTTDSSGPGFVMSTIRIEKREVIESCLNHALFPPKTTRHLIPSRPLDARIPITWLKNKNMAQAEETFLEHLRSKKLRRLPEGSWVGSRRYLEEVFVFE